MKWLYRAAALLALLRIESTLTEIVQRLAALRELALHPAVVRTMNFDLPQSEFTIPGWRDHPASKHGVTLKQPLQSFNVSRGTMDPGPGTTGPTAATGRSDQASGETGEGVDSPLIPKTHPDYSRTSWLTPATEQEAGSPGPAPDSSATGREITCPACRGVVRGCHHTTEGCRLNGPSHNHDPEGLCTESCPAFFRKRREEIAASGHAVICIPSLAYPHNDCDLHPHVAGEAL